uniref:CD209 antigen-like protein A n=1 Tax=Poecilia reticulata TaxID=8081 RepID=A0A3P9P6R6_POERE
MNFINNSTGVTLRRSNDGTSSVFKKSYILFYLLEKTCPEGWRMFSCSCYLLSTSSGSWDEGRTDCRTRGGDLVVIDDDDEQKFISTFTNKQTWIGLNDKETEGSWKWVDGTPLAKYWAAQQPDNGGGDPQWGEEDCAHTRISVSWNDLKCSASLHWLCEKDPV